MFERLVEPEGRNPRSRRSHQQTDDDPGHRALAPAHVFEAQFDVGAPSRMSPAGPGARPSLPKTSFQRCSMSSRSGSIRSLR